MGLDRVWIDYLDCSQGPGKVRNDVVLCFSEEPKLRKLSQLRKVAKIQHFEDEVAESFVKSRIL